MIHVYYPHWTDFTQTFPTFSALSGWKLRNEAVSPNSETDWESVETDKERFICHKSECGDSVIYCGECGDCRPLSHHRHHITRVHMCQDHTGTSSSCILAQTDKIKVFQCCEKVGFSDKGVPVTQPPKNQMTWNFACRGFCVLLLSFGQVKVVWPL